MAQQTATDAQTEAESFSTRVRNAAVDHHHALYGLHQYHAFLGKRLSVGLTGSARQLLEDRAVELVEARHPHGVMHHCLRGTDTRVQVSRRLEARALYCEITRFLQGRSITTRQRKSLHRVRDELVDWATEQIETDDGVRIVEGVAFDLERLKTPVDVDDPILERAKRNTGRSKGGLSIEQVELSGEHPADSE